MIRVDVVSPEFPCGAAWLASALVGLGVRPSHLWGFDTESEWELLADGSHRYIASHLPWRQTIAPLVPDRLYRFDARYKLRFTHAFPWQFDFADKVIIVTRDPRDALYSEWQRHRRNLRLDADLAFPDFLTLPFFGGPVSIEAMLRLHMASWLVCLGLTGRQFRVLRFEDWKAAPLAALRSIATWLQLDPPEATVEAAASASEVSRLQHLERELASNNTETRQFNRRGQPNEWREVWRQDWTAALPASWRHVFAGYGYAAPEPLMRTDPDINWHAFFEWRNLSDRYRAALWQERITHLLDT